MDYFFLPAMEAAAGCAAPPLHIVQKGPILFKISESVANCKNLNNTCCTNFGPSLQNIVSGYVVQDLVLV